MADAKLKAAPDAEEAAGDKKKSKKLLIIGAAVGLVAAAAAAYFMLFAGGGEEKAAPKPGVVAPLEPITINLDDGHYLKLALALQATADAHEPPEGSKALDLAIQQFSNRSVAELSTNKAREQAKKELLKKIEEAYHHDVMDVYFTEFVMQ
ncbi:flagellar basal body-associated FliL family protein [Spirillospora albida]|uniref:flagellar basal body-associated FliL family protein n=1 Tax=Spirillospora albida TaxID=58123 RepID=UPI0004BF2880|nr:flagellar basal body-associated FliL family protein [Spirillospora albida]